MLVDVKLMRQDVDISDSVEEAVGIAAALRVVRDGVAVDRVMDGGPAWLGALQEGWLITSIDGAKVTGHFHSNEISDMIRGPEGSRVTLEVVPVDATGYHDRSKIEFVDLVSPVSSTDICENIFLPGVCPV